MHMQAAARRSVYQSSLRAQATGARWLCAALLRTQAQGEWTGKGGAAMVLDRVARAALGQRRLAASVSQKSSIVALYRKYTRALTFENVCQAVRRAGQLLAARAGAKKSRERHVRTVAGSHIGWHLSTMVVRCAYLGVIAAGREHLCRAATAVLARIRHATRVSATHVMQAVLRMSVVRREFAGAVAAARVLAARVRRAPVRGEFVAVVGSTAAIRRCVEWLFSVGKGYV